MVLQERIELYTDIQNQWVTDSFVTLERVLNCAQEASLESWASLHGASDEIRRRAQFHFNTQSHRQLKRRVPLRASE